MQRDMFIITNMVNIVKTWFSRKPEIARDSRFACEEHLRATIICCCGKKDRWSAFIPAHGAFPLRKPLPQWDVKLVEYSVKHYPCRLFGYKPPVRMSFLKTA